MSVPVDVEQNLLRSASPVERPNWRWLIGLLLAGALILGLVVHNPFAATPTGARWVYNDWVNNMQAISNAPASVWTPAAVEAYLNVPNERTNAFRAGFGINLQGHSADYGHLFNDLSAMYTRLSEMISLAQTGSSGDQNRRARIIQQTVRDIILGSLPQAPHAGFRGPNPVQAQSDQDVMRLLPELCTITNRVAKVFYQHFVAQGSSPYTPDCMS